MTKKFLHVGCGHQNKSQLKGFNAPDWQEIRFDIDPSVHPDIVGSLTDLSQVGTASVNAVFSSHNIEHLHAHEVPGAIREFHRVLKDDGFVVITCPDLQSVCKAVAEDKLLEPLYVSPAGPISPLDILYGHRGFIAQGNVYMAHKCGFTYSVLLNCFAQGGFVNAYGGARPAAFDLWMIAYKAEAPVERMEAMAQAFFPG
ncbi:hypothetical protein TMEC54S_03328 [Thauera mechernichensis]